MSSLAQRVNPKGSARSDGPGELLLSCRFMLFLEAYRVALSGAELLQLRVFRLGLPQDG
jgi:hypothetical protein